MILTDIDKEKLRHARNCPGTTGDWEGCTCGLKYRDEIAKLKASCWLIEGGGVYWHGRGFDVFGPDIDEAVRFSRQQDAERVLRWVVSPALRPLCRTVEHVFMVKEAT